jgi:hypothetical protein
MTVMGDAARDKLSDRGSIPLRSTKKFSPFDVGSGYIEFGESEIETFPPPTWAEEKSLFVIYMPHKFDFKSKMRNLIQIIFPLPLLSYCEFQTYTPL